MNRVACLSGLLVLLVGALPAPVAHAAKVTHNITYGSSALATTLWYPDDLQLIRGVVVFTGGQGSGGSSDTRALVDDRFWQRFSESFGFAIMGDQFSGSYTNAANGPGMALLDSLSALATDTGHPELAHAPLLVEGFSNGGYFSFTFAQFAPTRVIAFCLNKSGYATAPLDPAFLAVPGFLIWGSEEPASGTPTVIHDLVSQGRKQHALWAELREWGAQHEEGSAVQAFAPFFAEMIAARYPATASPLSAAVALTPLREQDGFLGDHGDASVSSSLPSITSFAAYGGDKTTQSWLPSAALANIWRGFVTKSPIGLDAPSASAQLDATQTLTLTASNLGGAPQVSFFAGADPLASEVAVSGGQAKASWAPEAGGVLGILAMALDAGGAVARISRPANVVLYGKPLPMRSMMGPSAGSPASAGGDGAGGAGKSGSGGAAGAAADSGGVGALAGTLANDPPSAGTAAAGTSAAQPGADTAHASGGCSVGPVRSSAVTPAWALGFALGLARWARTRSRKARALTAQADCLTLPASAAATRATRRGAASPNPG
jgi:hypothetical protein